MEKKWNLALSNVQIFVESWKVLKFDQIEYNDTWIHFIFSSNSQ